MFRAHRLHSILTSMVLIVLLALAACGGASVANGSGTPASTAAPTTPPTATPKPKPSSLPPVTLAFCQSIMTVDEANSIMMPATPATMITVLPQDSGRGSCTYDSSPTAIVLDIFFTNYTGPVPVPQQEINSLIAQASGQSDITVNSATAVNGVGDQAEYVETTVSGDGPTIYLHFIYALDGKVLLLCTEYSLVSRAAAGTQSQFQQCAEQVISRL